MFTNFVQRSCPKLCTSWWIEISRCGDAYWGGGSFDGEWPIYWNHHNVWGLSEDNSLFESPFHLHYWQPDESKLQKICCVLFDPFWVGGSTGNQRGQQENYNTRQEEINDITSFIHVVSNICHLSPNYIVRDYEHSEYGRKAIVRQKQKNILLMKYLVHTFNYLKPSQLDLNPFAHQTSTAKVSRLIYKHCNIVWCDKEDWCWEISIVNALEA